MIPKKNCLDHKMKPFMGVLLVFLVMIPFILTACSSRSSNEEKKKGRPHHKGYIKLYEWKEFPQNNLSAVLKDRRQIRQSLMDCYFILYESNISPGKETLPKESISP